MDHVVHYTDFELRDSAGRVIGILNGNYQASYNGGQQPGWYALRKIREDGSVDPEIVANFHAAGV